MVELTQEIMNQLELEEHWSAHFFRGYFYFLKNQFEDGVNSFKHCIELIDAEKTNKGVKEIGSILLRCHALLSIMYYHQTPSKYNELQSSVSFCRNKYPDDFLTIGVIGLLYTASPKATKDLFSKQNKNLMQAENYLNTAIKNANKVSKLGITSFLNTEFSKTKAFQEQNIVLQWRDDEDDAAIISTAVNIFQEALNRVSNAKKSIQQRMRQYPKDPSPTITESKACFIEIDMTGGGGKIKDKIYAVSCFVQKSTHATLTSQQIDYLLRTLEFEILGSPLDVTEPLIEEEKHKEEEEDKAKVAVGKEDGSQQQQIKLDYIESINMLITSLQHLGVLHLYQERIDQLVSKCCLAESAAPSKKRPHVEELPEELQHKSKNKKQKKEHKTILPYPSGSIWQMVQQLESDHTDLQQKHNALLLEHEKLQSQIKHLQEIRQSITKLLL